MSLGKSVSCLIDTWYDCPLADQLDQPNQFMSVSGVLSVNNMSTHEHYEATKSAKWSAWRES